MIGFVPIQETSYHSRRSLSIRLQERPLQSGNGIGDKLVHVLLRNADDFHVRLAQREQELLPGGQHRLGDPTGVISPIMAFGSTMPMGPRMQSAEQAETRIAFSPDAPLSAPASTMRCVATAFAPRARIVMSRIPSLRRRSTICAPIPPLSRRSRQSSWMDVPPLDASPVIAQVHLPADRLTTSLPARSPRPFTSDRDRHAQEDRQSKVGDRCLTTIFAIVCAVVILSLNIVLLCQTSCGQIGPGGKKGAS